MKTLATISSENILSNSEMLFLLGGTADQDPDNTEQEEAKKKKDDRDYQTIDTEFDFWPEPEE